VKCLLNQCRAADFPADAPALDANWRAVVLFGRGIASYEFALAKTLLGLADRADDCVGGIGLRYASIEGGWPRFEHAPNEV
jgi:hypothetical protein